MVKYQIFDKDSRLVVTETHPHDYLKMLEIDKNFRLLDFTILLGDVHEFRLYHTQPYSQIVIQKWKKVRSDIKRWSPVFYFMETTILKEIFKSIPNKMVREVEEEKAEVYTNYPVTVIRMNK